ncbi:MAG: 16S rRNA (guanine(527)-N(7))-methyltransferase RsmG [Bacilli bacterium]|nr:16S rRNA (guanine(527)-N(7))-methyltransferase RsmG [Bacilli bacterium]
MDKEEFIKEVSNLGIEVSLDQLEKLDRYYDLLVEWNKKINLTAIVEKKKVYLKHFYDSLTLVKVIDLNKENTFLDVGTGAGFPGIVIKIFFPHLKVTLLDSIGKRIVFLKKVINELKLDNILCVCERAEVYACSHRNCYDVVTARAVSSINILLELCLPMVKKDKYFLAMRGKEEYNYTNALNILGGKVILNENFLLPYEKSERNIIKIKKENNISIKYPRKFSEIKKRPL